MFDQGFFQSTSGLLKTVFQDKLKFETRTQTEIWD
jgi:hypothetical protein